MNNDQGTVMGPGGQESSTATLTPPKFSDVVDLMVWREAINYWSQNVLDCAAGGDNKSKEMATVWFSPYTGHCVLVLKNKYSSR